MNCTVRITLSNSCCLKLLLKNRFYCYLKKKNLYMFDVSTIMRKTVCCLKCFKLNSLKKFKNSLTFCGNSTISEVIDIFVFMRKCEYICCKFFVAKYIYFILNY